MPLPGCAQTDKVKFPIKVFAGMAYLDPDDCDCLYSPVQQDQLKPSIAGMAGLPVYGRLHLMVSGGAFERTAIFTARQPMGRDDAIYIEGARKTKNTFAEVGLGIALGNRPFTLCQR